MAPSRYARKSKCREPIKYFLAFEGSRTEYNYFNPENLGSHFRLENIEIIPLQRMNGDTVSDPEHVIGIIDTFKKVNKLKPSDTNKFSIIIDYDRWGDKKLSHVKSKCSQKKYSLYVSNPCIELWFILHKEDVGSWEKEKLTPCKKCKQLFSKYFNGDYSKLYPLTEQAIKNAKTLNDSTKPWPTEIGTNIYKLIEDIIK